MAIEALACLLLLLKVTKGYKEPTYEDFFPGWHPGQPIEPVRYTSLHPDAFEQAMRLGRPFIVSDGGAGPFKGWGCEKLRTELGPRVTAGDESMRLEYSEYSGGLEEEVHISRTKDWMDTKASNGRDGDALGPRLSPHYWGLKNGQGKASLHFKSLIQIPSFMRRSEATKRRLVTSPELWLSGARAGAKAHQDSHCDTTISVQLSSRKRWRLGPPPAVENIASAKALCDSCVNVSRWKPVYDFTIEAGEALLLPAGYLHESTNIGEGCAASLTMQFGMPQPVDYIKSFLPRLLGAPSLQQCRRNSIFTRSVLIEPHEADYPVPQDRAEKLFRRLDADGDSSVTLEELSTFYQRQGADEASARQLAGDVAAFHSSPGRGFTMDEMMPKWLEAVDVAAAVRASRDELKRYRDARRAACIGGSDEQSAARRVEAAVKRGSQAREELSQLGGACLKAVTAFLEVWRKCQIPTASQVSAYRSGIDKDLQLDEVPDATYYEDDDEFDDVFDQFRQQDTLHDEL